MELSPAIISQIIVTVVGIVVMSAGCYIAVKTALAEMKRDIIWIIKHIDEFKAEYYHAHQRLEDKVDAKLAKFQNGA
jgi:uncharacterized membrane protein YczE